MDGAPTGQDDQLIIKELMNMQAKTGKEKNLKRQGTRLASQMSLIRRRTPGHNRTRNEVGGREKESNKSMNQHKETDSQQTVSR